MAEPPRQGLLVVTGAAGGIGRHVVKCGLKLNWRVIGCDVRSMRFEAKREQFTGVVGDVRDPIVQTSLKEAAERRRIDAVVLCAARGPMYSNPTAIVETNLLGSVRASTAWVPGMRRWGVLVLLGSSAAHRYSWDGSWDALVTESLGGARNRGVWRRIAALSSSQAYSLSKWGLMRAACRLAGDVRRHGIRVNVVIPGPTHSMMAREMQRTKPGQWRRVISEAPIAGVSRPQDIAEVIVGICGRHARMLHGSVLYLDGGWHAERCATDLCDD